MYSLLEGGRGIAQPKREAHALPLACMAREHREVFILLGYWHLPVAGVSGRGRDHPGIPWGIHAFIHPRKGVRVHDSHQVQLSVVNTEACRAIRLRHHNNWASPIPSEGLYNSHRAHALDLRFLSLPGQRPGLVELLPHGDSPGLQTNAVFYTAYQPQVTPPAGCMPLQEGPKGP